MFFGPIIYDDEEKLSNLTGSIQVEYGNNCTVPTTVYSSLGGLLVVQLLIIFSDAVIGIVSARGNVLKDHPRRHLDKLLYVRGMLFIVEIATLVYSSIVIFSKDALAEQQSCPPYAGALKFSTGIIVVMWCTQIPYVVGIILFCTCGIVCYRQESDNTHHKSVHLNRMRRCLKVLSNVCCIRSSPQTSAAIQDLAKALLRISDIIDDEFVTSDVIAGILLIRRNQKKKIKEMREAGKNPTQSLTIPLREVHKCDCSCENQPCCVKFGFLKCSHKYIYFKFIITYDVVG